MVTHKLLAFVEGCMLDGLQRILSTLPIVLLVAPDDPDEGCFMGVPQLILNYSFHYPVAHCLELHCLDVHGLVYLEYSIVVVHNITKVHQPQLYVEIVWRLS